AHLPALVQLQASSNLALKAVYSHSRKSAVAFAEVAAEKLGAPLDVYHDQGGEGDLKALLAREDIDAVIIALPITVQPDVIRQCLAAGKHVLSEKPVAPSVKEGEELIAEYEGSYKGKGIKWRVAENWEAEPAFRFVRKLIEENKIGKVAWWTLNDVGDVDKDGKWYKTPWRTVPDYQGGFLLDGGVHSAAVLRTALPSHPIALSGYVSLVQPYLAPTDTLTVVAQSSDGSHGTFELSKAAPTPSRKAASPNFKVTGTEGWIDLSLKWGEGGAKFEVTLWKRVEKAGEKGVYEEVKEEWAIKGEGVDKEVEWWIEELRGIEGEGKGLGEPREALRDVKFIEAGLNSKGERITL
ncbi:hypothetical protein M422DRAFT_189558, partial [Sphaerobolus stellatus SS14]